MTYWMRNRPWKAIGICTGIALAITLVICAVTIVLPFWLVFPIAYYFVWRLYDHVRAAQIPDRERLPEEL